MIKDFVVVKCPKCGYEYVAAEIFLPKYLLGKPNNIIRDDAGHIMLIEGEQPCSTEDYECEHCGTLFKTTLDIKSESKCVSKDEDETFTIDLTNNDKEELF